MPVQLLTYKHKTRLLFFERAQIRNYAVLSQIRNWIVYALCKFFRAKKWIVLISTLFATLLVTKIAELEITKLLICSQITTFKDNNGDDEDRNGFYDDGGKNLYIKLIYIDDGKHLPGKVDWLDGQPPLLVRTNIVMIGFSLAQIWS